MATKVKKQLSPEEVIAAFDDEDKQWHFKVRNDPIAFAQLVCGFEPNRAQRRVLTTDLENKRAMLPWGRRFGKSWIVAVYLAHRLFSIPGYNAYIFAPSGDQSSVIFDYIVQIFETSEYLKRYVPFNVKGNALFVGDKDWRSRVEKVKTGLVGDNARGKGVQDGKGLIVFDEIASFIYPEQVTAAIKPYISPGGGYVLLSSPGEVGSWMHETYLDWQEQERLGSSMHVVFEATWEDCDHIKPEVVAEEKREATAKGRLWEFEREYLGRWTVTDGAFFNAEDVRECQVSGALQGSKGDVWVVGVDPGLDASPMVILWARFNPLLDRLEVCDCYSFIRDTNKKADRNDGHIIVTTYEEIITFILDQRKARPIHCLYLDTGIEKHIGERLANSFRINVIPDRIGGYNAKLAALKALQRSLADQRIVWQDHRITSQLLRFSPPINRQSGNYDFPDTDYDIISALCSLNRYLGDVENIPFACVSGGKCEW